MFFFFVGGRGVRAKHLKIDVIDLPDHGTTDRGSHIREMVCTNIKGPESD